MGGVFLVRNHRQWVVYFVLVMLVAGYTIPGFGMSREDDGVWQELAATALGQHRADAYVDKVTFLSAAVRFITFEKGEDPIVVAKKQGYVPLGDLSEPITLGEALAILLKLIDANGGGEALAVAQSLGICEGALDQDRVISVAQAEELLVNTRSAWYRSMQSRAAAEPVRAANYYLTSSIFKFSQDETKIIFDERGTPQVVDLRDGKRLPFDAALLQEEQREEPPVVQGKNVTGVYDNEGLLRVMVVEEAPRFNFTTDKYILYRENSDLPWQRIVDFDLSLNRDYEVVGFTPDNQRLYVKTNFYDPYITLYEVNPETLERSVLYQNPDADVAVELVKLLMGIPFSDLRDPKTGQLLATYYVNDKLRSMIFDERIAKVMKEVEDKRGPHHYPILITSDYRYLVVKHLDDRDLGSYFVVTTETGEIVELSQPAIAASQIAPSYPVSFLASDGGVVYGYLTVPLGKSPQNLPLLINAHGGPELRFSWTPNPQTIVASNLGIAVLSVNFRFSIGYGRDYVDAGSQDKIRPQRDLHDAALWAIKLGIADPEQIGVMGHSYGGYSSFYQAATYPELYKVAIPQMGVWDWNDLGEDLVMGEPYPADHLRTGPLPRTGLARLISPSSFARDLKAPLLIVYSGQDEAVYPAQNIRAIKELTEAGNTPEVLFLPDDPHGPASLESADVMLEAIRSFLMLHYPEPS